MFEAHWSYVKKVLKAHGEDEAIIEKCGFRSSGKYEIQYASRVSAITR